MDFILVSLLQFYDSANAIIEELGIYALHMLQ